MLLTLKKPELLKIYLIPLLIQMTGGMATTVSVLYAIELKADILQVNLITSISTTVIILAELPLGILSDRLGRKPMLIFMLAIGAFGTLIRIFATVPSHLIFSAFFGGNMGFGDFYSILLSMIADVADPDERQEAISTMYLFSGIGMFVSPIICTSLLLLPQITLRTIYQISFVAQMVIIMYIIFKTRETKSKIVESTKSNSHHDIKELIRQKDLQALSLSVLLFTLSGSIIQVYLQIYGS